MQKIDYRLTLLNGRELVKCTVKSLVTDAEDGDGFPNTDWLEYLASKETGIEGLELSAIN